MKRISRCVRLSYAIFLNHSLPVFFLFCYISVVLIWRTQCNSVFLCISHLSLAVLLHKEDPLRSPLFFRTVHTCTMCKGGHGMFSPAHLQSTARKPAHLAWDCPAWPSDISSLVATAKFCVLLHWMHPLLRS